MDLHLQTKVSSLLEAYPALEKVLIEISPVFAKLKNPILRRTVAKVTTLKQAAEVAGIPPVDLVLRLRKELGLPTDSLVSEVSTDTSEARPGWLNTEAIREEIDAQAIIDSGQSPLQTILQAASRLQKHQILVVSTSFNPVPIIDLLLSKRYQVWHYQGKTYISSSSN